MFGEVTYISNDLKTLFKEYNITNWMQFLKPKSLSLVTSLDSFDILRAYVHAIRHNQWDSPREMLCFFHILCMQDTHIWFYCDQDATFGVYIDANGNLTGENALGETMMSYCKCVVKDYVQEVSADAG